MDASVLIGTFNRCSLLAATLDSLAAMRVSAGLRWEVIVVDNNSTDSTRDTVEIRRPAFPAPLRYIFEPRQGKSHAVNTGLAASGGAVVAFTDDDVHVHAGWLEAAISPLMARPDIQYTGGPVFPIWEAPPPPWLTAGSGVLRGPLALLDYGPDEFVFEDRQRIPVGVNMAVRRSLIDAIGGFRPDLGRVGKGLLGQEQAEFFFRTRAAGLPGLYVPAMRVDHHVPASRMTASYHRRWWYWKGVARGRIEDWHRVSELGLDLQTVPRFLRLPRFMWRSALEDVAGWLQAVVTRPELRRIEREVKLTYFAGYFAGRMNSGSRQGTSGAGRPIEAPAPDAR